MPGEAPGRQTRITSKEADGAARRRNSRFQHSQIAVAHSSPVADGGESAGFTPKDSPPLQAFFANRVSILSARRDRTKHDTNGSDEWTNGVFHRENHLTTFKCSERPTDGKEKGGIEKGGAKEA